MSSPFLHFKPMFNYSDQIGDVYFVPTLAYTSPRNGPCAVAGFTLFLQLLFLCL